ncbi:hypothetical protein BHM03_00023980 [Ensete ventricosum]|nr:hypothetical protein BHM03_00023980 [Ensete ventricosum]
MECSSDSGRATLLLAPNVVSLPPRPMDSHNGVRAASTRDAPRWQSEVGVCRCSDCDFDVGLPNLVRLFLQDKTSQVVGSHGGPSDNQVRVDRKGEVLMKPDGDYTVSDAAKPQVYLPVCATSPVCVREHGSGNWSSDPILPRWLVLGHVLRFERRITSIHINNQLG